MIKFLDLHSQYQSIKEAIDVEIASVIADSEFVGGRRVSDFEKTFARYQQAAYCIGVANGTDALEIALEALDLPQGEVLVPANSFIASAEAVTRSGHRVVFCDVDPDSYCIDLSSATDNLTDRSVAIMPVHLYGQACDMDRVTAFARDRGLAVIEDCAQAHGAEWKDRRVGSIGDIGTFSFYPGKNLGAYGDGGAVVTNDAGLADRVRRIANHGRVEKYLHEFEGRNSRLDSLQAAVLMVKLTHLERWIEQRQNIASAYQEGLADCPELILPGKSDCARHVYHLYVVRTHARDALRHYLSENGIETGVHYPTALPKLPAYRYLGEPDPGMFANQSDASLLSLPIGEHMSVEDARLVVQAIRQFFSRGA